jgi:hypothetical protein
MVMIMTGGLAVSGIGAKPIGVVPYVIAGILVVAGVLMFVARPFVFWVAMAAAGMMLVSGGLAYAGKPQLALPFPWWGSVFVGVYLIARALIARPRPAAKRRTDEDG